MNRREKREMSRPLKKKESEIQYKRLMRFHMLANASESLTAAELKKAMTETKVLDYIDTVLDENGVPTEGESKSLKLSNLDILRLGRVLTMKENQEKEQ